MAAPLAKITMTVPKPMLKAADRIAAAEYRTRAEVFREALREYIWRRGRVAPAAGGRDMTPDEFERAAAAVPMDDEPYTVAERAAVARAEAAIARGEYVTLERLKSDLAKRNRKERGGVAARRRPPGPKAA